MPSRRVPSNDLTVPARAGYPFGAPYLGGPYFGFSGFRYAG